MSSKRKLCEAIIEQGALRVDDLTTELTAAAEAGEYWGVRLGRDASLIWGGVERVLPAGTELGEVYIDFEDGETAEDVPYMFLTQPEHWRSVEALEREMIDAA